jgi:hypothetical protein
MNLLDLVVGKPISTSDERAEQIGVAEGVPIFGLDGLSSAAYGPEAALSLLIPLSLLGVKYIVPRPPWAFRRESGRSCPPFRACCRTRFRSALAS